MSSQQVWSGQPSVRGPEMTRMALLAFTHIGTQICWIVEMGYCTPYLLQLGLSKSRLSLVWIAGPLSGLVMQPVAGVLSDRCTSRWGRRRPYILGGTLITAFSLYTLGWSKEVAQMLSTDKSGIESASIVIAVISIYVIDFAVNAVMATCRSLIVDTLPITQQQQGSAWASRMVAIGTLSGHALGSIDLSRHFGTSLGDTQFKQLISLAMFISLFASLVTSCSVKERVLVSNGDDDRASIRHIFAQLYQSAAHPPPRIRDICRVQFWAWIGWFPFMFYSVQWVGEIHLRYEAPAVTSGADATTIIGRVGSRSMMVFALLMGLYAIILPWFILSPTEAIRKSTTTATTSSNRFLCKPSLLSCWTWSQIQFSAVMIFAPFVTSVRAATLVIALGAIPFSMATWAPFVFLGIEIKHLSSGDARGDGIPFSEKRIDSATNLKKKSGVESENSSIQTSEGSNELAGRYLGILNVYSTIPQLMGNVISMVVFAIFEPGRAAGAVPEPGKQTGFNGIAICFAIGALSSLMAARASRRLRGSS